MSETQVTSPAATLFRDIFHEALPPIRSWELDYLNDVTTAILSQTWLCFRESFKNEQRNARVPWSQMWLEHITVLFPLIFLILTEC